MNPNAYPDLQPMMSNEIRSSGEASHRRSPRAAGLVSIALYLISLSQTGFFVAGDAWKGWGILVFGALGALSGEPANLIWFCNPLLFVAWICHFQRERWFALCLSVAALMGGLLFLACRVVRVSEAGGDGYPITSVGAGYWLWIASMLTLVCACIYSALQGVPK